MGISLVPERSMKLRLPGALLALLIVSGCSINPPKPPTCDGSDRHPINTTRQQPVASTGQVVDTCSRG